MRRTLIVIFPLLFLLGMSLAQTSTPAPSGGSMSSAAPETSTGQSSDNATGIASGSTIPAELAKSLDAKKNKQGDRVEARITQDLLSNGEVVVPRGAKIIGHVTQTQPRAKGETSSMIGIAFDQMVMKNGKTVPMDAAIQAIAKPVQSAALAGAGNEPMSESGGMPAGGGMHGSAGGSVGGMGRGGYPSGPAGVPNSNTGGAGDAADQGPGGLTPGASGVIGLKDLSLSQGAQGSVISSDSQNVHLDSGTQLMLKVK